MQKEEHEGRVVVRGQTDGEAWLLNVPNVQEGAEEEELLFLISIL